jgi:hypothetical protein
MVTLNTEEVEQMRAEIAAGKLSPSAIKNHLIAEEKAVFGADVKHDRKGNPIEDGIGSALQPSANSVEAYAFYCRDEPDYAANLAKMRKDLAAYLAKKKSEQE